MIHLYDRAGFATVPTLDIDAKLKALLTARIAALTEELLDCTEYLIVQAGDSEDAIVRHVGFSPLIEPIEGGRYGGRGFHAHWDYLAAHHDWYEMIVTFGSAFAYVLLIEARDDVLGQMCSCYAAGEPNFEKDV